MAWPPPGTTWPPPGCSSMSFSDPMVAIDVLANGAGARDGWRVRQVNAAEALYLSGEKCVLGHSLIGRVIDNPVMAGTTRWLVAVCDTDHDGVVRKRQWFVPWEPYSGVSVLRLVP